MLKLENISKTYALSNGDDYQALRDVNLVFPRNGMIIILGKSGSGKSALLSLMSGLESPSSGKIFFQNKLIIKYRLDEFRQKNVGIIFRNFILLNNLTVLDNLTQVVKIQNQKVDKEVIYDVLSQVGLKGFEHRNINKLSSEELQRLAIARAIIENPKVILMDELDDIFDFVQSKQIFQILKEISQERLVVVISNEERLANLYADRVIYLDDGKLVEDQFKNKSKEKLEISRCNSKIKKNSEKFFSLKTAMKYFSLKPIANLLSLLLITITMILFGTSLILNFQDKGKLLVDNLLSNHQNYVSVQKFYNPNSGIKRIMPMEQNISSRYAGHFEVKNSNLLDMSIVEVNHFNDYGLTLLSGGNYPNNFNEIVISKSAAKKLMEEQEVFGMVGTLEEVIGKLIDINLNGDLLLHSNYSKVEVEITGIVDDRIDNGIDDFSIKSACYTIPGFVKHNFFKEPIFKSTILH